MDKKTILFIGDVFPGLKDIISKYNKNKYEVKYYNEVENKKEVLNKTKIVLSGNDVINDEVIKEMKSSILIQNTGIGCDNIDLAFAKEQKLPVANAPQSNSIAVAELTIALILNLYRKIVFLNDETKKGNWLMWEYRKDCFELYGKVHGIIGFGQAGKHVAERSKAFGTKVYYYDKIRANKEDEELLGVNYLPLNKLLEISDILSVHIPLLPETRNLISAKQLDRMKSNAIIINVSRGGIINESALFDAIASDKLAGSAIDVWETEPVEKLNPLLTLPQVIATPHIGAATKDTMDRVYEICFDNIDRAFNNEKLQNVVNQVNKL